MQLTLREEILVVAGYEAIKLYGKTLRERALRVRRLRGDMRNISAKNFVLALQALVDDGYLDPFARVHGSPGSLMRLDSMKNLDIINHVLYGLTHSGYEAHLKLEASLAKDLGDFRKYLRKKSGRS